MSRNSEIPIAGGLDVALPKMATAHQRFNATHISDVEQAVLTQMSRPEISARVTSGMTVAIGAGSRGVANIDTAVRATVQALRERGAEPFIFPAMGSHAGATAEGQQALLAGYGITEDGVGAPVRASMDTVQIAEMADGTPLHIDRHAPRCRRHRADQQNQTAHDLPRHD